MGTILEQLDQFHEAYKELTEKGWEVDGIEKHEPCRALGRVHCVRILTAHKGRAKITRRFVVSHYPLSLYSGKVE